MDFVAQIQNKNVNLKFPLVWIFATSRFKDQVWNIVAKSAYSFESY